MPGPHFIRATLLLALLFAATPRNAVGEDAIERAKKERAAGNYADSDRILEEAMAETRAKLEQTPNEAALHYELARLQFENNQTEESLKSIEVAIKHTPGNPDYHLHRGLIFLLLEKPDDAVNEYKSAATLSGEQPKYSLELGQLLIYVGRNDEAIEQLRKTVKSNPDFEPAFQELVRALAVGGQLDEAIALLTTAVEKSPDDGAYRYALGRAHLEKGQFEPAYEQFSEAVRIHPTNIRAEEGMFLTANSLGRKDVAAKHYANIYRLFEQGHAKLPYFKREEFKVGKKSVSVSEHFKLRGPTPAKYEFWVNVDDKNKSGDVFRLGTDESISEIARSRELVRDDESMYYLYGMIGPEAEMQYFAFFPKAMPDYAVVRSMVVEIVEGKRKPVAEGSFEIENPAEVKANHE